MSSLSTPLSYTITRSKHRSLNTSTSRTGAEDPPICKLDETVLWYILDIIAQMDDEINDPNAPCAVDSLRHASQVHSWWRKVVLSSSSLWGAVINLNRLHYADWRHEVLRRAKGAWLNIHGEAIDCFDDDILSMLFDNWKKIRRLQLSLCGPDLCAKLENDSRLLAAFNMPAKGLQSFVLSFHQTVADAAYWKYKEGLPMILSTTYPIDSADRPEGRVEYPHILTSANDKLFVGNAPNLTALAAPNFVLDLHLPWKSNLQALTLTAPALARDVLNALEATPMLKSLHIHNMTPEKTCNMRQAGKIHLPSLSAIYFPNVIDINAYISILINVRPADNHNLIFSACEIKETKKLKVETVSKLSDVISMYTSQARPWLAGAAEMTLCMLSFELDIQISGNGRTFVLEIGHIRPHEVVVLSRAFNFPTFDRIEKVKYHIDDTLAGASSLQIAQNIHSIASVKVLASAPHSLISLLSLPDHLYENVFDNLQQINMQDVSRATDHDLKVTRQVLERRMAMGMPISMLHIFQFERRDIDRFLMFADIPGLQVVIPHGDYQGCIN